VNEYGLNNVLCAVPLRRKGKSQTASETLNEVIRECINPVKPDTVTLTGCFFRENDRVMYLENNDDMDISNGDCGTVKKIDTVEKKIYVNFDCGKLVEMTADDSKNMTFAYAMSVHKAQGSEFKAVIVTQCWEDYYMLSRSLFYTAVTRAKEKVVLIGDTKGIRAALRNIDSKLRNTRLKQLLGQRTVI
jgi:exodeoxyribonuclease V alpha subunit